MAAGLGFKTFTTGEVLTAADTNGYLMQGVLVFASAAARDAAITSPQEGQFAYLKDTNVTTYYTGSAWANLDTTGMNNPMTTTGDMVYSSSGSTPARLGIGSTGNVLTVSGGVPVWSAPGGGGKVLQVVQGTLTSSFTTTSGSFVDVGLEATITPSSASSKVMVFANFMGFSINSGASASSTLASMILLRASTQLQGDSFHSYKFAASNGPEFYTRITFNYLDSPATTSATTYKIQAKIVDCTSCGISASATKIASIVLMEIGA